MVALLLECPHLDVELRTPDGWQQTALDMVVDAGRYITAQPFNVDAQREIITMLRAEPERRVQQRCAAFAMGLIPRLGVASRVAALDKDLVRMVLQTP